jgi:high-affinity iron transporter
VIPTLVIAFRETLEAALVVSIVLAAARGVAGRIVWVAGGVLAGLAGALIVAALADVIAGFAEGMGVELFNATILLAAVLMLGWHQVWMSSHGAEIARATQRLGGEVAAGRRPLSALAVVCAIAVLREGSETVLFLYGIATDPANAVGPMLLGGGIGMAVAAAVGWLLYTGLARIPMRLLFRVTGIIVTLLAAGMAAQAALFLVQAGWLPPLGFDVWDTSWLISDDGLLGQLLHILVGYVARPLGIQLLFYAATLLVILVAARLVGAQQHRHQTA